MRPVRERPERVLVVRTGAIGDVVNALVVATGLRAVWPGTRVDWVAHSLVEPLVEGHPDVERVHAWARSGGASEWLRLRRRLRAERYDLALDLQRIAKSGLAARLSGARRLVGFDRARTKEGSWLLATERLPARGGDPNGRHMVEHYLDFVEHLTGERPAPRHRFPSDPEADAAAAELVRELGCAPVAVAVGATKPANRWLPERFGELARRIAGELDLPVVLTGGPDERTALEPVLAGLSGAPGAPVVDRVGRTSLRELSALLARCALFVGCDTGPMHLAAARGLPVVALFGPADPRRTGPFGGEVAGHRVVRVPPPCAPCGRRTCNQPRHACMEDLSVELVFEALRERVHGSRNAGTLGR